MPLDQSHSFCCTVEASFPLHGEHLAAHQGAALYAALCELEDVGDWVATSDDIAIAPIAGHATSAGLSTPDRRLTLRLPAAELPRVLGLAGRSLEVAGQVLDLGQPQITLPRPTASLSAELVVFDDVTGAGDRTATFLARVQRQLTALEIAGEPVLGANGALRMAGRAVPGFALTIRGLAPDDSIHLQEAGLGDHRKLGCGVFAPG